MNGGMDVLSVRRMIAESEPGSSRSSPGGPSQRSPLNRTNRTYPGHTFFLALCVFVILVGVGLAAYPWVTNLWAARVQDSLKSDLPGNASDYRAGLLANGEALMRVRVPRLDIDVIVVEGTSEASLRAGAGHYPSSDLPESSGNVAIAGHRTTFGKPFNRMDELTPGDEIFVTTPLGRYTYTVIRSPWVVVPTDLSPLRRYPKRGSFLTLMSCHPEGSATYRIVARARLTRAVDRLLAVGGIR